MAESICRTGTPLLPAGETRTNVCLDDGFCIQRAIRIMRVENGVITVTYLLADGTEITAGTEVDCPPMIMAADCRTQNSGIDLHIVNYEVVSANTPSGLAYQLTRSDGQVWEVEVPETGRAETVTTLVHNTASSTFTYTNENGTKVTVPLLGAIAHANTATVTLAGIGTVANPLTATVNISAQAGNAIRAHADGLYAEPIPVTKELREWGTNDLLGHIAP